MIEFTKQSTGEKIEKERWQWEAHYEDGTILRQFDSESGFFHNFDEIDQKRLRLFRMVSDEVTTKFNVIFRPKDMKLIHFYRINKIQLLGDDKKPVIKTFKRYYFGYEMFTKGVKKKVIAFINPDNDLVMAEE